MTVENVTNSDITLACRTTLGWLNSADAIYPLGTIPMEGQEPQLLGSSVAPLMKQPSQTTQGEPWDPAVDVSHLSEEQRQQVKQMVREECDIFAKNDWDTGCIKDLVMDILLTDNHPVQKMYNAIPRHLYQEDKARIQDLLRRG